MVRKLAMILSVLGFFVSLYLLYAKLNSSHLICGVSTCAAVNESDYSYLFGIPISAWGVLFYISVCVLILLRKYSWFLAATAIGVVFSIYLSYLEVFVILAWCQWCVLSAWLTIGLFVTAIWLYKDNKKVDAKKADAKKSIDAQE